MTLDLLHVIWGEDQGVVSLREGRVLFYCWGDFYGHHAFIPTVGITDEDFQGVVPLEDGELNPTWDDVVSLLTSPCFPLEERIRQGEPTT